MTGRFPSSHGAGIQRAWLTPGTTTIAHSFRSASYRTSYHGKYHLTEGLFPEGFLPSGTGGFEDTRFMFGSLHVGCLSLDPCTTGDRKHHAITMFVTPCSS